LATSQKEAIPFVTKATFGFSSPSLEAEPIHPGTDAISASPATKKNCLMMSILVKNDCCVLGFGQLSVVLWVWKVNPKSKIENPKSNAPSSRR
jgi:hypothetical protein